MGLLTGRRGPWRIPMMLARQGLHFSWFVEYELRQVRG